MSPNLLAIIAFVPMLLAVIVGLAFAGRMPRGTPRVLAVIGLVILAVHAVWSLVEALVLHDLFFGNPTWLLDVAAWLGYLIMHAGFVPLALAATTRAKPAGPRPGYAPYPSGHHYRPGVHPPPAPSAPDQGPYPRSGA